jgi:hypothetical protein
MFTVGYLRWPWVILPPNELKAFLVLFGKQKGDPKGFPFLLAERNYLDPMN